MESSVWDKRYGSSEYVYGQEPNVFIAAAAERYLKQPCSIVELASGEGRNVVHLAKAGHNVAAVDWSQAGLDKTRTLAEQAGCGARITYHPADVTTFQPPQPVQAVVLSFCHIPAPDKPRFIANALAMLARGGLVLCECFHPDQIAKGYREKSGGPHDPAMMWSLAELRGLVAGEAGQEEEGSETEYELREGSLHHGLGAVTRWVWRKGA
uniref:Methyltransferase domain-containing protein n=1 Tax=Chlamydomonas leiostraca TaxID=1034604 RepID=A0A7S0R2D5_9CHLO|mmetsp:Transcript_12212/g.29761  ORF Transcript_12212/g.29761 Transcript_12212/m.29761 type:complete len:210 (+) Transcript_12212:70-699(+)|eukprot:CAMPEP_0202858716 /NCGR_PEP_ID=MMETSP1391-20130828/1122_1 /ASSEMBLY_ACC=CAM_ASM_000867 /TAXON_ID=1034604 /ORGANISM="Chlamydomonas leiostraca, Strain SAG 11-49" /LENGTH=209 /DNA_ID=CAMNT_0049537661 /DNA_START=65 /DNA_END=694 /DNA_ORIENTATION=+